MDLTRALAFAPLFALAFFRVAGVFLYAPLFGSTRVPRRVKLMLALVITLAVMPAVPPGTRLPDSTWGLAAAITGELLFGLALGMALSMALVAAQWAGQMVSQQLGFNLGETIDPQYGGGTLVGDLYFLFALVVFLLIGGHRLVVQGLADSFAAIPLLTATIDRPLFDLLLAMFGTTAGLALRLAGPTFVALLAVDLALGCIGKTMPQMNLMTSGLSVRAALGIAVVVVGFGLTYAVLSDALAGDLTAARAVWTTPQVK